MRRWSGPTCRRPGPGGTRAGAAVVAIGVGSPVARLRAHGRRGGKRGPQSAQSAYSAPGPPSLQRESVASRATNAHFLFHTHNPRPTQRLNTRQTTPEPWDARVATNHRTPLTRSSAVVVTVHSFALTQRERGGVIEFGGGGCYQDTYPYVSCMYPEGYTYLDVS